MQRLQSVLRTLQNLFTISKDLKLLAMQIPARISCKVAQDFRLWGHSLFIVWLLCTVNKQITTPQGLICDLAQPIRDKGTFEVGH